MIRFLHIAVFAAMVFIIAVAAVAGQNKGRVASPRDTMRYVPVKGPDVTLIDENALKERLKPTGKPLLINFWATWCVPCREEFPDLVRLDAEYRGRIDFITISLDDLAEIKRDVPRFLAEMRAEMPAYLLKTADENAAIAAVSPEWRGGLPFSILIAMDGKTAYLRQGKILPEIIRKEIDKLLIPPSPGN